MKLLICDDESNEAEKTKSLVQKHKGIDKTVIYTPDELLFDLEEDFFDFDIAILDIEFHRNDINGISFGHMINEKYPACQVIYLTKITDYASDVYETEHVYFVTKQNAERTIERALDKAIKLLDSNKNRFIEIYDKKKKKLLSQSSIQYIEKIDRLTTVHTSKEDFETYKSLLSILRELSDVFVRCHGSFIVNFNYVKKLDNEEIELDDGKIIPIGRTYKDKVIRSYIRFTSNRM